MKTLKEIKEELKDRNIQKVAKSCDISAASIYRLMKEESEPLYSTVKALNDYLEGKNNNE